MNFCEFLPMYFDLFTPPYKLSTLNSLYLFNFELSSSSSSVSSSNPPLLPYFYSYSNFPPTESSLCCPTTLWNGPLTRNHIIKENGLSLSNANRSSMSGWVCVLPPFLLGFCLAWFCTDNHYDVVSATVIFKSKFYWYYPSLWFS